METKVESSHSDSDIKLDTPATLKGYFTQNRTKIPLSIIITFKSNGSIKGQGTTLDGSFTLDGKHENMDRFSYLLMMDEEPTIFYKFEGNIIDKKVLEGSMKGREGSGTFRLTEGTEDRVASWRGYTEDNGTKNYMKIELNLKKDGTLSGKGQDDSNSFSVDGKFDDTSVNFALTYENDSSNVLNYEGKFSNMDKIEGTFKSRNKQGSFLLWVDQETILKDKATQWKGYYLHPFEKGDMDVEFTFKSDGTLTGKGTDPHGSFTLEGKHDNFKTFNFIKKMDKDANWTINYKGSFTEGTVIEGKYTIEMLTDVFKFWLV